MIEIQHAEDTLTMLKNGQQEDPYCQKYIKKLSENSDPAIQEKFQMANGLLNIRTDRNIDWKFVVPQAMSKKIIELHHDHELSNHPGTEETLRRIKQKYAWKGMRKQISEYVKNCEVCAQVKTAGRTIQASLTPRKLNGPFHTISIDLMGPYTRSRKGKKYILVATDLFSKWVEAYPLNTATSSKIIQLLEQELFSRFGYPKVVISDNGSQFTSKAMQAAFNKWQIIHHTTAIYAPHQSPVERQNQQIKNKLRVFLLEHNHNQWDENLEKILFSMRNSAHVGLKFSPSQILFGRSLRHPGDIDGLEEEVDEESYAQMRATSSKATINTVLENARKYQERYAGTGTTHIPVGQEVYIRNHILSDAIAGVTSSFSPKWISGYKVQDDLGSNVYLCVNINNPRDKRKVDITNIQLKH